MKIRRLRVNVTVWGPPVFVGIIVFGCGGTASRSGSAPTTTTPRATSTPRAAAPSSTAGPDVVVTAKSFRSLRAMTPIRGFFVENLMGDLSATVAVANARDGGTYPPGTLIQLFPQEAMVKHRAGWNASTHDWEFFFLDVSAAGTKIVHRGTDQVVNRFGSNCASCHSAATAKFDFVCEKDHGCAPLPISDDLIKLAQLGDPRPNP
jgi:hypothetical protein